jgi:hypothetical protein
MRVSHESKKLKRQPLQLSLLDALTELDGILETVKKSMAKVESEIGRSLNKAGWRRRKFACAPTANILYNAV